MVLRPFITGSYAYGTPTKESDVDLVILLDPYTAGALASIISFSEKDDNYGHSIGTRYNLTFGKLNLIVCTHPLDFFVWKRCTEQLIKEKPVTRDRAVEVFTSARQNAFRLWSHNKALSTRDLLVFFRNYR